MAGGALWKYPCPPFEGDCVNWAEGVGWFHFRQSLEISMHLLAFVTLLLLAAPASATSILDFETLAHNDLMLVSVPTPYFEDGFRIDATQLVTIGSQFTDPLLEPPYSGSTALYDTVAGDLINLSEATGALFDVLSIDLSEANSFQSTPFSVTFTGDTSLGAHHQITFTLDGTPYAAETFFFDGRFRDLTALSWRQENIFGARQQFLDLHQFDNIVVNPTTAPNPIPEPSTMLLFGSGLAGLAAWRYRKSVKV